MPSDDDRKIPARDEASEARDRKQGSLADASLAFWRALVAEVLRLGRRAGVLAMAGAKWALQEGSDAQNRDAWFIGFSETLVIGVWVGNDDASPMTGVTGGGIPVDIWRGVMQAAQTTEPGQVASQIPPMSVSATPTTSAVSAQCNVRACARTYRSFRASDCSFQPYRGPRQLCTG